MTYIVEYMTQQHRCCDESFAAAEEAVSKQNWSEASAQMAVFSRDLGIHFTNEEEHLFLAFEEVSGNTGGPTSVMRVEHQQMRGMVESMTQALQAKDADNYLGLSETLMILMQQHNMKEEQILYPMTQQMLPDTAAVISSMNDL
ncbi:hemerythrin domain-containing protein [Neptunomonas sp.]|uniref:hemerythrin domain-containing protein n=1 Tax=Neptunomonas sp. TaxID=1971898 RepID=UPI0025E9A500|nr:hemerythrin domain-containing protein [Neptunomonas sp.]